MQTALSVIFSILAVPGLYYILTLVFRLFSDKSRYFVAVEAEGLGDSELISEIHTAELLCEGCGKIGSRPVVVFSGIPSDGQKELLHDYGVEYAILFKDNITWKA